MYRIYIEKVAIVLVMFMMYPERSHKENAIYIMQCYLMFQIVSSIQKKKR